MLTLLLLCFIIIKGKNVEAYNLSDITREVGIGTEEMQCLAMLLGSDYTEGINGVMISVLIFDLTTYNPREAMLLSNCVLNC